MFIDYHRLLCLVDARVAVSVGSSHCVAVGRGGDCFVWGDGDVGQLGLGKLDNRPQISINNSFPSVMQVTAGSNHTAVLTKSGQVLDG